VGSDLFFEMSGEMKMSRWRRYIEIKKNRRDEARIEGTRRGGEDERRGRGEDRRE